MKLPAPSGAVTPACTARSSPWLAASSSRTLGTSRSDPTPNESSDGAVATSPPPDRSWWNTTGTSSASWARSKRPMAADTAPLQRSFTSEPTRGPSGRRCSTSGSFA